MKIEIHKIELSIIYDLSDDPTSASGHSQNDIEKVSCSKNDNFAHVKSSWFTVVTDLDWQCSRISNVAMIQKYW